MNRIVLLTFVLVAGSTSATTWFVATNGSDASSGTSTTTPFATPQRAVTNSALAAGDTIYIRGGTYLLSTNVLPGSSKVGTAANYYKIWAYPGEQPIFDFSIMGTNPLLKGLDMRRSFWHAKGIEVRNAPDSGIFVGGDGNIIEGCVSHDCGNDGIILGSSSVICSNALILNCDSYRNFQPSSGGNNGDGFAGKSGCGPNNKFMGCRSYLNSDDGWDFYDAAAKSVLLSNCWTFMNGSNQWNVGSFTGNGNGFKLGGASTSVGHTLIQCLAFHNRVKGFDYNNSLGPHTLYNCTGFRNGGSNYKFPVVPSSGTITIINSISYQGGLADDIVSGAVLISNSWQNGLTVSAGDFQSLDPALAFAPRNADYSLPTNAFARLAAGSGLIDKGANVGFPFNGAAPDLGAYEFVPVPLPQNISIDAVGVSETGLTLHVTGLTSHGNIIVHISSDLSVWTPIYTNPPVSGGWEYFDSNASNAPQRFYKVQEQ
jgi:hypothetical protein